MTLRSSFSDLAPELLREQTLPRAETIPSAWFVDRRFVALDREAVFARSWQYVGHEGRVSGPGSWLVSEVAGEPVVVTRGEDGALRAFYNVCRHRGGPLALGDGCGRVLKCQYHGWTYRMDGRLRGVPHWSLVELFDRDEYGLVPLRVEAWEGLMFVNLDPAAAPLSETFAGIAERIAPIRLGDLAFRERVENDVQANWKVYVDTPEAWARISEDLAFADGVQDEEIEICEHVQRGLGSRGYDRGRFSVAFEGGVFHFQNRLRRAWREWLEGGAERRAPEPLDPRHDD